MSIYTIVEELTQLGQAITDATRVRIVAALRHAELCVCELGDALEIGQSTLSSHLQVLRQTSMVITRKEGRWIYYSLDKRKAALTDAIFSVVEREIRRDPGFIRDAQRIKRRLAMRENGRCTLGFSELEGSEVLSHARKS